MVGGMKWAAKYKHMVSFITKACLNLCKASEDSHSWYGIPGMVG